MADYDGDIKLKVSLTPGDIKKTSVSLERELHKIFNEAAGSKTTAAFKQLQATASKTLAELEKTYESMKKMEGTKVPTDQFKELLNDIKEAQKEYKELTKDMSEAEKEGRGVALANASESRRAQIEAAMALKTQIQEMQKQGREMLSDDSAFQAAEMSAEYRDIASAANDYNNKLTILIQKMGETSGATGKLKSAFNKLGLSILNGVRALQRFGSATIGKGIKNIGNRLNEFHQRAHRASSSIKQFIKAAIGISGLMVLFNKLKGAITEGIGNLEKYSPAFKSTMDSFRNALSGLKNAFGAAFAPILSAVVPALTTLINYVTAAVNAIGKLIAALTGRSTYTAAVSGFNAVGGAAGGAAGQAQKLKKELAGFDDVEILHTDDSSGGGGGGGGGGADGMFEEVPIDENMAKLAEMIKEAWEKADFTEIGTLIGTKLRDALEAIPWDAIKEKCNKIAKSIATFLNGFLETPGLFTEIGNTLGEALNTALGALNTFATNFHWDSLGKAIADSINGFFQTTSFSLAANTFSNWAKGLLESIYTALEEIDWRLIAQKVKIFLTNVDWSGIAEGIFEGIGAALGGIAAFVVELVKDIPGKIKEYFTQHIQEAQSAGGSILDGILQGIVDAITGIGTWIKEHIFDPFIKGFKEAFGIDSGSSSQTKTFGEGIINGILDGMLSIVSTIGTWINEHVLQPIRNAFGGFIVTISVALQKAQEWASDIWEVVKAGYEIVQKIVRAVFEKIGTWAQDVWEFVKAGYEIVQKIVRAVFEKIGTWASDIWDFVKTGYEIIEKAVETSLAQGKKWAEDIWNFITDPDAISKTIDLGIHFVETWLEKLINWLAGDNIIEKTLSLTAGGDSGSSHSGTGGTFGIAEQLQEEVQEAQANAGTIQVPIEVKKANKSEASDPRYAWEEKRNAADWAESKDGGNGGGGVLTAAVGLRQADESETTAYSWKGHNAAWWATNKIKGGAGIFTVPVGLRQADTSDGTKAGAWKGHKSSWWASNKVAVGVFTVPVGLRQADTSDGTKAGAWKGHKAAWWASNKVSVGLFTVPVGLRQADTSDGTITGAWKGHKAAWWVNQFVGGAASVGVALYKSGGAASNGGWSGKTAGDWVTSFGGMAVSVAVNLAKSWFGSIKTWLANFFGDGGALSGYGGRINLTPFANGGIITRKLLKSIPQYANGSSSAGNRAHGSLFIAGESGPEVIGHINNRTEILNKSQIASAIYSAVRSAMLVGMHQLYSMIPIPMPISLDINSLGIPEIVAGQIIPYAVKLESIDNKLDTLQNSDSVTNEELRKMLADVIKAVDRVQFYIGDEQIARHVNIGNQKLDRRYNPIIQGG